MTPVSSFSQPSAPAAAVAASTLIDVIERAARLHPRNGVLCLDSSGAAREQTYAGLLDEAARVLAGLRALGIKAGDSVIFQLEDNADFIAGFWGCVLGGMVPVPVSISPTYESPHSILSKLKNAWTMLERPVVLCGASLAPRLRAFAQREAFAGFRVEAINPLRRHEPANDWHRSRPDDLALLLLTSGSTGMPKAVRQTHGNLSSWAASVAQACEFDSEDISINWMPLDHVGGLVMFHLRDVALGCRQIHAPTEPVLQRPLVWLEWIEKYRATITWAPNFAYGLVNELAGEIATGRWDLSSMRFILNGGEAIVSKTARRFLSLLEPHGLPATAMRPAWGMSETCSGVTYSRRFTLATTQDSDAFVEVGEVIPGVQIRIADQQDNPVEAGKIGRLQIRGISVTPGYHQNPEANEKSFTADGWFITGDLGVVKDGQVSITGREKDVIIINGVNFYSHEIESVVEEIPGVEVSFTAACPIRIQGENTDRIAVFFSPSAAAEVKLPELAKTIRMAVARKEGVTPDFIVPLAKEEIPKTAIGKIQRAQLKERFEKGDYVVALARVAPAAPSKALVGVVWREAVGKTGEALPPGSRVLIFADTTGLGARIAAALSADGHLCVTVQPGHSYAEESARSYRINPTSAPDYQRLFTAFAREGIVFTHALHLWGYGPATPPASLDDLEAAQVTGSFSLLRTLKAWSAPADEASRTRFLVVTSGVQSVADEDVVDFAKAPLLGVVRTVPEEYAWLDCAHLDLPFVETSAGLSAVIKELAAKPGVEEVAFRNGRRFVRVLSRLDGNEAEPAWVFEKGGFYVLSGGFGGIAQVVARHLAENFQARLLLLGRGALPGREQWAEAVEAGGQVAERLNAWKSLELAGAEVRYEAGVLEDAAFVRAAVERAAAHWERPLSGIIHLAGAYRVAALCDETAGDFWGTVKPKLAGAWSLQQTARSYPGCLFISFSSLLGHFSASGHAAYVAANASLDQFVFHQRKDRTRAVSLSWSLWSDTGIGRGYDAMQERGYVKLDPKEGAALMVRAAGLGVPRVLIGLDPAHGAIRRHLDPSQRVGELSSSAHVEPRNETERVVTRMWEEILGVPRVGVTDNFFELGGRSLLAARLFARIEKELGHKLPLATLFKAPTVESLVALFGGDQEASGSRVLAIQPQGALPPFFCIPGGGSDVIVFQDLSREMGPAQPFYGLQARGLDATPIDGAYPSIEEVAADFIKAIKTVQAQGPYHLGGHCFGSLLAWETARQLRAQGERVGLLALLDPIVSNVFSGEIMGRDRLRYHAQKFWRMSLAAKVGYFWEKVRNFSRTLVMRQRISQSFDIARSMHDRYKLGAFDGAVLVFMADDSFFKVAPARDPRRYYEGLASGGARYLDVQGDHHSMLHDPGVAGMASGLRAALAAAQKE